MAMSPLLLLLLLASAASALPDLTLDVARLANTLHITTSRIDDECLVESGCIPAVGTHRLLRFATRTHNIAPSGDAGSDFYVGIPNVTHPERWEWHACHQHWHMRNYVTTELFRAEGYDGLRAARQEIRPVAAGSKHSFCLRDTYCERVGASETHSCAEQGISAGCYDEYGVDTQCQWLVIDDLPDREEYVMRITVDPHNRFAERDKQNNVAELRFRLDELPSCAPDTLPLLSLLLLFLLLT